MSALPIIFVLSSTSIHGLRSNVSMTVWRTNGSLSSSARTLHHVPSVALQNQLLREVARVLRPGGVFVGTDSLTSRFFRLLHLFDVLVVVDPATFAERLARAGFRDIAVDVNPYAFRFRARRDS